MLTRLTKTGALVLAVSLAVLSLVSCKDSESPTSPTATGSAMITGTVVSGETASAGTALPGVTVRILRTGQVTQTNSSGDFSFLGVPAGDQDLLFSRSDIDARGTVSAIGGATTAVSVAISRRSTIVISPRGGSRPNLPAQTETQTPTAGTPTATPCSTVETQIEGIVTGNSGGTLTIFQQGMGTFTVTVTGATIIRKGQTPVSLGDIVIGWRVHVKALRDCSGNFTAEEVIVQNTNVVQTPATGTPTAAATNTPTAAAATNTPTATSTAAAPTATSTRTMTPTAAAPTMTPTPTPT